MSQLPKHLVVALSSHVDVAFLLIHVDAVLSLKSSKAFLWKVFLSKEFPLKAFLSREFH